MAKLERQLAGAPRETILLGSRTGIPPGPSSENVTAATKIARMEKVLSWVHRGPRPSCQRYSAKASKARVPSMAEWGSTFRLQTTWPGLAALWNTRLVSPRA